MSSITSGTLDQVLFYQVRYSHTAATRQLSGDVLCKHRPPKRTGRSSAEKRIRLRQ